MGSASETLGLTGRAAPDGVHLSPASDGTFYYTDSNGAGPNYPGSPPYQGEIWKYNPTSKTHTILYSTNRLPTAEHPGDRIINALATAPDDSVYLSPSTAAGNWVYIDHVSSQGTFLESWVVDKSNPPGIIAAMAVGPNGTPYYLLQSGTCLRLYKLEPDGRTPQVAGGDCSNQVASGDGGPAIAATFKATSAVSRTLPVHMAAGADGSIYIANQSECTVRRISPSGIISTFAGSTCPTGAGQHTGDGGLATSAKMIPTAMVIGPDDTLYVADYDYWEVQCTTWTSTPGCYLWGTGSWMQQLSRVRAIRGGMIQSIAGAQAAFGPKFCPALQRPIRIIMEMLIGVDKNIYYLETQSQPYWGAAPNPVPDDWPDAMRRVGIVMPPIPQTGAIALPSQNGQELYNFSAAGQHLSTQDALTGATLYQFGYDGAGRLTSITDANNLATTIVRDPGTGLATAIVSPTGQQTSLTMTDDGYLSAIDEPGGAHRGFTYDGGLLKSYTKPNTAAYSFTYDELGRLVHEDMPGGGSWTLTRTGPTPENINTPVRVTAVSAEGKEWKCNRATDSAGSESRTTSGPSGLQSTKTISEAGVTTVTAPDGMSSSVTDIPDAVYGMQAPLPGTSVVTTPGGKQMTTIMSRASTLNGTAISSRVDTISVNGKTSTSTYDAAAKTITNKSPVGRQTVTTLDAQGRVTKVQTGSLAPTAYAYDTRGRLSSVTVGTGTAARVTSFGYDAQDRLSTVTDPLTRVQSYTYDDANRVVGQTLAGNTVGFGYDANGNVTSVTPPERTAHGFGFTANDLMSSYTPPVVSGTGATTYEYNLDKQPTVIHRPDGSTINFTYDSAGRLATTTYPSVNGNITVTKTYSPTTGKLTGVTTSDGQSLAYGYDGKLITSTTWSGNVAGGVGWTYDNNFRVVSETVNGANSVAFTYDDDGLSKTVDGLTITRDPTNGLVTDTVLSQVTNHRTYDSFGKLATYEAKFGTTSLYSVSYVPDSLGRFEQKTETIQGVTTVWNYSYDSAGRLWQVMQNGVLTATYGYDPNGNRWSVTTPSGTKTATYDAQDRLLTYGNWSYTYTANGDLQTKTDTSTGQVMTYGYDAQGNLRHVGLPDGRAIDYLVDSENRRVAKKVNGAVVRKWIYEDQLKPVAEFDGTGTLLARYLNGITVKGSTSYRVVTDHLGTPRLLVNSTTGAVAQRLDLDEWGQVTADSSAGFQVFGFAGGIYDSDTGLVRFGARDYDPVVGRWTAKDPIRFQARDSNLYRYLKDDPVNGRDPTGLDEAAGQNAPDPHDAGAPLPSDNPNDCRSPDCLPQGDAIGPGPACITSCAVMWGCAGYVCAEEGGAGCLHMAAGAYNACLLVCAAEAQAKMGSGGN